MSNIKIVDSREPECIRQELLKIGWTQEALWTGDYFFLTSNYKKVGIERKSVGDLLNSLGDRLSAQLFKMLEYYDFNILMIEGNWKIANGKIMTSQGIEQWGWSTVWNYLQTWQDRGLTIQLSSNEGHTIKRLNELYTYYMKDSHAGGLKKQHVEDNRILALQCGGIGPVIGKKLLEKFGSIKNIANAEVEQFLEVEKVGSSKAMALWNHFNKDTKEDNNEQKDS